MRPTAVAAWRWSRTRPVSSAFQLPPVRRPSSRFSRPKHDHGLDSGKLPRGGSSLTTTLADHANLPGLRLTVGVGSLSEDAASETHPQTHGRARGRGPDGKSVAALAGNNWPMALAANVSSTTSASLYSTPRRMRRRFGPRNPRQASSRNKPWWPGGPGRYLPRRLLSIKRDLA